MTATARVAWRAALAGVGALLVVGVTHDLGYLIREPLWGDEAWIVVTRLFPIADLPALTSSAPIGWNLLVRAFSELFGDTSGRILVQLFNAAAVAAAFYVGRWNPLTRVVPRDLAGAATALAIAFAPFTLVRLDLKHYTSDAFFTLLLLALLFRILRDRTSRALPAITAVSAVGLLFSFAVLFVAVGVFAALLLQALLDRDRRRAWTVAAHGAVAGVGIGALYLAVYARGDNPALREFWGPQFPVSVIDLPRFTIARLLLAADWFLFGSAVIACLLALAGLVLLVLDRKFAAVTPPVVAALALAVLGLLHRYPYLDARTSTFFIVLLTVYAALALLRVGELGAALVRRRRPESGAVRRIAIVAAAVVATGLVAAGLPNVRAHSLPGYDTQHQAEYVLDHRGPDDLVIFNELASYQLAFDWDADEPSWCPDPEAWTGFYICYPEATDIRGFDALDDAYALIDAHLAEHPGSRVWIIRSNVFIPYARMERDLFARYEYQVIDLPYQPVGVVSGVLP